MPRTSLGAGIGSIVLSTANDLGPGKIMRVEGSRAIVEYFRSVGDREMKEVPTSSIRRVAIHRQTRCYIRTEDDQWEAGRVLAEHGGQYEVHLPDRRSQFVSEGELFVRCHQPGDPTDTLVVKGHETVFFHTARSRFVRCVVQQRAGYRGLTALASAAIELYPHQVEVVRRVLEDPIQRYLLADEVGLGKTIEAAVIVRQMLIDDPTATALVAVPDHLVQQWQQELVTRIGLEPNAQVVVCPLHEAIANFREILPRMLVIDEAHHVATCAFSQVPTERTEFHELARVAHEVERLLLLSATPAANHETQFLAMLHLLDPQTYRLEDLDAFRLRVEKRQAVGRLLLAFTEDADPFALTLNISQLRSTFATDPHVLRMSDELAIHLSDASAQRAWVPLVGAIRSHVSETYRLHRRMLRSNRHAMAGTLAPRAHSAKMSPSVVGIPDSRLAEAHALIDDWRAYAAETLETDNSEDNATEGHLGQAGVATAQLLALMLDCAATSMDSLCDVIRVRLGIGTAASSEAEQMLTHYATAFTAPPFPSEQEILRRLLSVALRQREGEDSLDVLSRLLRQIRNAAGVRRPPRCVVFAPRIGSCAQVASRIASAIGRRSVACATGGDIAAAVEKFRSDHDCFVLVCDSAAEEGLNLQFADHLMMLDVPWSPNALEQRIGRVDRIGRTRPVDVVVFLGLPDAPDSLYAAWLGLLRDGLGIFRRSIAGLQFFVNAHQTMFFRQLLSGGAAGLSGMVRSIQVELAAEEQRIAEQNVLDAVETLNDDALSVFGEMDDLDAESDQMRDDTEAWLCHALRFSCRRSEIQANVVTYDASSDTLVPSDLVRRLSPELGVRGTYRRSVAVTTPGVRLRRVGDPLIDALWDYVQWDDRGQAFAVWRCDPTWDSSAGNEWVGFKIQYIVQADLSRAQSRLQAHGFATSNVRSLSRRADALLPPKLETLFFDSSGQEVVEEAVLRIVRKRGRRRSDGGSDTNLTKERLRLLGDVIDPNAWEWTCRTVRENSERSLRARASSQHRWQSAAKEAERRAVVAIAQLRARAAAADILGAAEADAAQAGIAFETEIAEAIAEGVRRPELRVNSIGCIVVSGRHPDLPANLHEPQND